MEITELRIKNFVVFPGWIREGTDKIWRIRDLYWDDFKVGLSDGHIMTMTKLEHIKPIPLTPDWLAKMAISVELFHDGVVIYKFGKFNAYHQKSVWLAESLHTGNQYDHIGYVHQLQNLYFAMTGKELEVK